MHDILNRNVYLVKEHLGLLKAANNYDIYDPQTKAIVMQCREERMNPLTQILRFTDYKRMTPFDIEIRTPQGERVIRVKRGISLFLSNVEVMDEQDRIIGGFKQKLFSIGGAFTVLDAIDRPVCQLQGNWVGWNFRFLSGNRELARVTKEWGGLSKELLTTADDYILQISDSVPANDPARPLILAAVMCIDMVLKE